MTSIRAVTLIMAIAAAGFVTPLSADAGVITDLVGFEGSGLGTGDFVAGDFSHVNDDNVHRSLDDVLSGRDLDANFFIMVKEFSSVGPIDAVFDVQNSSGTTEYLATESVVNSTGKTWSDYHLQLGYGTGNQFVASGNDGLDFDTPDRDPSPNATLPGQTHVSPTTHADDAVEWKNGFSLNGDSPNHVDRLSLFTYSLDVPDAGASIPEFARTQTGYRFTLRQLPTVPQDGSSGPVVPEPGALVLMGLGLFGLGLQRRRQR